MSGGTFCGGLCARGTPSDSDQVLPLIRELDWACVSLHVEILLHGAPPLYTFMRKHTHLKAASHHHVLLPPIEWSEATPSSCLCLHEQLLLSWWTSCFFYSMHMIWCVCHNEPQRWILCNNSWLSHSSSAFTLCTHTFFYPFLSLMLSRSSFFLSPVFVVVLQTRTWTVFLFLHSVLCGFSFSAILSVSLLLNQPLVFVNINHII